MNFDLCNRIIDNMSRVIVGKTSMELSIIGLLAEATSSSRTSRVLVNPCLQSHWRKAFVVL